MISKRKILKKYIVDLARELQTIRFYTLHTSMMKLQMNPTPSELKAGIYKPRLTVTKRMNKQHQFVITMKVEFSIPKLLYGNNFDEVEDTDFEKVAEILKQKLQQMGVYVLKNYLYLLLYLLYIIQRI